MSSDSSAREWKRLEPTEPVTIPCAWSHRARVSMWLSSLVAPKLRRRRARSSEGPGTREDAAATGSGDEGWPMPAVTQAHCWQRSGCRCWQRAGTKLVLAKQSFSSLGQGLGWRAVPTVGKEAGASCMALMLLCCQCARAARPFPKGGEHSWESPQCSPSTGRRCVRLPRTEQVPALTRGGCFGESLPQPLLYWWPPFPFQSKLIWHLPVPTWGCAPLTFSLNSPSVCPRALWYL